MIDKTGIVSLESLDYFLEIIYPEATRYFREIEEVIDGEKCFNVGKLRKIYENLDPSVVSISILTR